MFDDERMRAKAIFLAEDIEQCLANGIVVTVSDDYWPMIIEALRIAASRKDEEYAA